MKVTFKEGIRSKILLGISLVAVLLFASNIAITNLFAFELGKVMVDIGFSALSICGLSIVFFLAINLLSRDIHDKTVYMILSKPVTRSQYIWGKFGGLALILATAFVILGLLTIISFYICCSFVAGAYLPRNFSWHMASITISFSFLSLLVLMATAFFFTVNCSSMYLAMLVTFCTYMLGNTLETIVRIMERGEFVKTSVAFTKIMKIITWIVPNFAAFDLKSNLAYGLPTNASYLLWTGAYGCFYTIGIIMVTAAIFKRMDIC